MKPKQIKSEDSTVEESLAAGTQREHLEIGRSLHYENMDFSQICANSEIPALEYDATSWKKILTLTFFFSNSILDKNSDFFLIFYRPIFSSFSQN